MGFTKRVGLASILGALMACSSGWGESDSGDSRDFGSNAQLGDALLLVPQLATASVLLADFETGAVLGEHCLSEIVPEQCNGEPGFTCLIFEVGHRGGVRDGLEIVYGHRDPDKEGQPSTLISVDLNRPSSLRKRVSQLVFSGSELSDLREACSVEDQDDERCILNMAHTATPLPSGPLWAFADTRSSRVVFAEPDWESGELRVEHILDKWHPDWINLAWVNHIELIEEGGRLYMLTTFKGGGPVPIGTRNAGRIVLWDITDLSSIQQQWVFPEEGYIAAPHKAQRILLEGQDLLLYAHSMGASDSFDGIDAGSVGLAQFDLNQPPVYLGDWVLPSERQPLGFLRDVELLPDGKTLLLADSGCESLNRSCMDVGGISTVAVPGLPSAPDLTGAFQPLQSEQVFRELEPLRLDFVPPVSFAYEADVVAKSRLSDLVSEPFFDRCLP